jgi:3-deoxy-D-manno-octulosonate 8-phosphate phosphatase (KDO 8-P phosphatase)
MNSKKFKKIKLVLTDVDGVLTDGGRYYSDNGEILKKFDTRDGMGVNILLRNNIQTGIMTKENSKIVKKWAKDMNICFVKMGIKKKELELEKICDKYSLNKDEIAYIGDDVNDLLLLKKVGFSGCPFDGIEPVKKIVDYVCKNNGGHGTFREFSEVILKNNFGNKIIWY